MGCHGVLRGSLILITNKTVDKKSSHNPYTQDYAKIFCTVFNWFLVSVCQKRILPVNLLICATFFAPT